MFRFVHASDLHLGAAFEGIREASPDAAEVLRGATYAALDTIVQTALDERAAFVLLAGDVCNRADGNLRAELALRTAARKLHDAGISLFVVYGNHDYLAPGRPDLDWPDSAWVFGADAVEPRIVTVDGEKAASVSGISYGRRDQTENLALRFPKPPDGMFSVGLLHAACGSVGEHAAYSPCTVADLSGLGYDYWALGHVHTLTVVREAGPTIVYPGAPQGLNPKEEGPKGCCLVTVADDRRATLDFRETDAVRWKIETIDIGPMEREQDVVDALEERLSALAGDLGAARAGLVRFRLTGRGPLHGFLNRAGQSDRLHEHLLEAVSDLPGPLWTESVQVATRPDLDLDARRQAEDFLGDFLRIADGAASDEEKLADVLAGLRSQVSATHGRALDDAGVGLNGVTLDDVAGWLRQAEALGADMLLRAED